MVRGENWFQKIRDLDTVQSEFGDLVMMRVIDRQLWSANKRLLADRYTLLCHLEIIGRPFTKYVNIKPFSFCWQTPEALYKRQLLHCSKDCSKALVSTHIF